MNAPGTACAGTVHTLFRSRLEIRDFRILATKLDDHVSLRIFLVNGFGFGDDLLNEGHVEAVCKGKTA